MGYWKEVAYGTSDRWGRKGKSSVSLNTHWSNDYNWAMEFVVDSHVVTLSDKEGSDTRVHIPEFFCLHERVKVDTTLKIFEDKYPSSSPVLTKYNVEFADGFKIDSSSGRITPNYIRAGSWEQDELNAGGYKQAEVWVYIYVPVRPRKVDNVKTRSFFEYNKPLQIEWNYNSTVNSNEKATKFKIEVSENGGTYKFYKEVDSTSMLENYIVTDSTTTTVQFRVQSINGDGTSDYTQSNISKALTDDTIQLSKIEPIVYFTETKPYSLEIELYTHKEISFTSHIIYNGRRLAIGLVNGINKIPIPLDDDEITRIDMDNLLEIHLKNEFMEINEFSIFRFSKQSEGIHRAKINDKFENVAATSIADENTHNSLGYKDILSLVPIVVNVDPIYSSDFRIGQEWINAVTGDLFKLIQNRGQIEWSVYKQDRIYRNKEKFIYGIEINNEVNTDKRVVYTDDCKDFKSMKGIVGNGQMAFGDWIYTSLYKNYLNPCVVKDGKVAYYLDKKNLNRQKDSGVKSVLTGEDGDVMLEIKRLYVYCSVEGDKYTFKIANYKVDKDYHCLAHTYKKVEYDNIFLGYFPASSDGTKLYSHTDGKVIYEANNTIAKMRGQVRAKGINYQLYSWDSESLLRILFSLLFKTTNSELSLGIGLQMSSSSPLKNGINNDKGMIYGKLGQTKENGYPVSFLIENFYGSHPVYLEGIRIRGNRISYCDGIDFDDTEEYTSIEYTGLSGSNPIKMGHTKTIYYDYRTKFFPQQNGGASNEYFGSYSKLFMNQNLIVNGFAKDENITAGAYSICGMEEYNIKAFRIQCFGEASKK